MQTEQIVLTSDIIIEIGDGNIVLVKRKNPPYKDMWALPGGMMDPGETIETTAIREAEEETGLKIELINLIGVYSKPDRDPRGRYISVLFSARPVGGKLNAGSDAGDIKLMHLNDQFTLAFDHNQMLKDYLKLFNR